MSISNRYKLSIVYNTYQRKNQEKQQRFNFLVNCSINVMNMLMTCCQCQDHNKIAA